MDFKAPKFRKGEMVRWHYEPEKSLGIVLEQSAAKVKVHWVISPRLRRFGPTPGRANRAEAWYPIYKVLKFDHGRRVSED